MAESDENPIRSIHDHGAGGHLNCLSELIEDAGGVVYVDNLPVGDPTLSDKEIIGNESQERMGLLVNKKDIKIIKETASAQFIAFQLHVSPASSAWVDLYKIFNIWFGVGENLYTRGSV